MIHYDFICVWLNPPPPLMMLVAESALLQQGLVARAGELRPTPATSIGGWLFLLVLHIIVLAC